MLKEHNYMLNIKYSSSFISQKARQYFCVYSLKKEEDSCLKLVLVKVSKAADIIWQSCSRIHCAESLR